MLLNFVDWYGDTIFNRLQIPQFLSEWARLADSARAQGAWDLFSTIAAMAGRCGEEVHTYLKFRGD